MKNIKQIFIITLTLLFSVQHIDAQNNIKTKNNTSKVKTKKSCHQPSCGLRSHLIDNFWVVEKNTFYRSGQLSAKRLEYYTKKYKIKTVVNLRGTWPKANWWKQELAVTKQNNVCFFSIPMTAKKLTSKKNIRTILNIFDTAPRPILVHCQGGADRTGEISALWVLDQQHKSNRTALKQLTIWNRYNKFQHPEKEFLIKIWKGREWFEQKYNPANFPKFKAQKE